MKKTNSRSRTGRRAPHKKPGKKVKVTQLPKMEMYAVLDLELGQKVFETVRAIEKSVEILAVQKKREMNSEKSKTAQPAKPPGATAT